MASVLAISKGILGTLSLTGPEALDGYDRRGEVGIELREVRTPHPEHVKEHALLKDGVCLSSSSESSGWGPPAFGLNRLATSDSGLDGKVTKSAVVGA